ncbi:sigma-54-dependent Fis family transcriptional regulator [Clostridium aciditolerans]
MRINLPYIRGYWEDCIKSDRLDENLDSIIRESWMRCRKLKVNPFRKHVEKLSEWEMSFIIKENAQLIQVAHPIMEGLYEIVAGSGFVIVLADKNGYIIDAIGNHEFKRSKELNLVVGANWSEKSAGTNAIGTSLCLDKPVQIIGAEHYCSKNHCLTCSAATIHDEENKIIGCINMSGNYSEAHSHTTGIVASGARLIEKHFALQESNKLLNVIFNSISEGMLVLDEDLKIKRTNKMASKILGISEEEILSTDINSLTKDMDFIKKILNIENVYYNLDCNLYIKNRRIKCSMNAFPIIFNGKANGIVITFKDEGYLHKIVNVMAGYNAKYNFEDIVTKNKDMKRTIEFAKKAAITNCSILIEGPSGTGKELFAQSIHNYSTRKNGPFVAVNCASLPKELMESELFGYEKGAFTGAAKDGHPGKFELADGGTIFLDEIGELPLDMQSKLLRVLDNNKITRLGGTYEKKLNVRIIAATNRDLIDEIKNKNFREDLYYRINVMNIKTLSLKQRVEDIEILANYFIHRLNSENPSCFKALSSRYLELISNYSWPGNVRQLRNVVERSYYLCESNNITEEYLYDYINIKKRLSLVNDEEVATIDDKNSEVMTIEEMEKSSIRKAIKEAKGDLIKAAEMLNISRATIYRKIKKYSINGY